MNTTKILAKLSLAAVGATIFGLATTEIAQAATITVNFDDLSGSGLVPDGYGGIIWDDNFLYYDALGQDPYNPSSPSTRIFVDYINNPNYPLDTDVSVPFKFLSPVIFDGAYFAGFDFPISFSLYNSGSLVANSSSLTPSNIPTFLSSGYSGFVDEVRLNLRSTYVVMDDVTYRTVAQTTPEPASMLGLLTVGSLGLGTLKRKQKA